MTATKAYFKSEKRWEKKKYFPNYEIETDLSRGKSRVLKSLQIVKVYNQPDRTFSQTSKK